MRVDVAALLIMVLVGATGVVPAAHIFDGFASNAVISIIAVMIMGAGRQRLPRFSPSFRRRSRERPFLDMDQCPCGEV